MCFVVYLASCFFAFSLIFFTFNIKQEVSTLTVCARVCLLPADVGCSNSRQLCGGNQAATERMIQFGRELQALNEQLCREYGKNATHKKMLQVHTQPHLHTLLISTNSCATTN